MENISSGKNTNFSFTPQTTNLGSHPPMDQTDHKKSSSRWSQNPYPTENNPSNNLMYFNSAQPNYSPQPFQSFVGPTNQVNNPNMYPGLAPQTTQNYDYSQNNQNFVNYNMPLNQTAPVYSNFVSSQGNNPSYTPFIPNMMNIPLNNPTNISAFPNYGDTSYTKQSPDKSSKQSGFSNEKSIIFSWKI